QGEGALPPLSPLHPRARLLLLEREGRPRARLRAHRHPRGGTASHARVGEVAELLIRVGTVRVTFPFMNVFHSRGIGLATSLLLTFTGCFESHLNRSNAGYEVEVVHV